MSDPWVPTPDERRLRARFIDGTIKEYYELQVGDTFQAIDRDGIVRHPMAPMDTEISDLWARVTSAPTRAFTSEGWGVLVVYGSRDEISAAN